MKFNTTIIAALLSSIIIYEASCNNKEKNSPYEKLLAEQTLIQKKLKELTLAQEKLAQTQKETNDLAINLTKYGNNPECIPALHYAILQEDIEAVDLFLKYGASTHTLDRPNLNQGNRSISDYRNSLYYALKAGNVHILEKLLDLGAELNDIGSDSRSAIINTLIAKPHHESFKFLITNNAFSLDELNELAPYITHRYQFTTEQQIEIFQLMHDQGAYIGNLPHADRAVAEFIQSLHR